MGYTDIMINEREENKEMANYMVINDKTGKPYRTRKSAEKYAVDAAKIVKVDGGYMAFSSIADYRTWSQQR